MLRNLARLVWLSLGLLAQPGTTWAGACPHPQLRVWPYGASSVPTNVQVRLFFEEAEVSVHQLLDPVRRTIVKDGTAQASAVQVELQDEAGAVVPTQLQRFPLTSRPLLMLKPVQPLRARARYFVVVRTAADSFVVSQLQTGDGPAVTAPTLPEVKRTEYVLHPASKHWKDNTGASANITLAQPVPPATGAVEVHVLESAQEPSEQTLRAVVDAYGAVVTLHEGGACHGTNFQFPPRQTGAKSQPLHLGLRAVDLAGNQSPLRRVTIEQAAAKRAR